MNWLLDKIRYGYVSLRFNILSAFIILFILLTLTIALVRGIAFKNELIYTTNSVVNLNSDLLVNKVSAAINPIEAIAHLSGNILRSKLITQDTQILISFTYYMTHATPLVEGAYWGNEKGDFIYAFREEDKTISNEIFLRKKSSLIHYKIFHDLQGAVTKIINLPYSTFDPRLRPWYQDAKTAKTTFWTEPYKFAFQNSYGVTLCSPVFDSNKKLYGAFGLDVQLDFISNFLNQQYISKNAYAFILSKKGDLVAFSNKKPFIFDNIPPEKLLRVSEFNNLQLITSTFDLYQKTGDRKFTVKANGENFIAVYQPFANFVPQGWVLGIVSPRDDFVGYLDKLNLITLGFSLLILILGICIVSNIATRIVRPIKLLVKETEKIKRFELNNEVTIKSRIIEVVDLRNAIFSMKNGLKQFQRYVPKALVRQLIESGQDSKLGGERKKIVVIVTDIKDFTTISESIDPNVLMIQLCEYFEALTQIIKDHKGTVDKFLGDSVMAFWGAPLFVEDAANMAATAALQCLNKVSEMNEKWNSEGKPPFVTRIGIHQGDAIVGNIGSTERLNYTAIGDTINIAFRCEEINKVYKTSIIVGDTIYNELKDRFKFRKIDVTFLKGRKNLLTIYELLGDHLSYLPFDLNAYNAAFDMGFENYQKNLFPEAINHFQHCLAIYPTDSVAPIFIKRCAKKIETP